MQLSRRRCSAQVREQTRISLLKRNEKLEKFTRENSPIGKRYEIFSRDTSDYLRFVCLTERDREREKERGG